MPRRGLSPELSAELMDADPAQLSPGSNKKHRWRCGNCGHEWEASVNSRSQGSGCPRRCRSGARRGVSLAEGNPGLAAQWADDLNEETPADVTVSSRSKRWWRCPTCGHTWRTSVGNRNRGSGCPACSGRAVVAGVNDLASRFPEVAAEWSPSNPQSAAEVAAMSRRRALWCCSSCGNEWEAMVSNRTSRSSGCPQCSGREVSEDNSLAAVVPESVRWWDARNERTPGQVHPTSTYVAGWVCPSGHQFRAPVSLAARGGIMHCAVCSGRRVLAGDNALADTHPELAAQWVSSEMDARSPEDTSHGSTLRVQWECSGGHRWHATVKDRAKGRGCPSCAHHRSAAEQEVYTYVCELVGDLDVVQGDRATIAPLELDILVPDLGVAVEFNGVFWHSERNGKGRDYHLDKWRRCRDAGIQLLTVWSDDWEARPDAVRAMLAHKLHRSSARRVFARKTEVVDVSWSDAQAFLDKHHIQGSVTGSAYLGLRDTNGVLVAVSVWQALRPGEVVLARYATSAHVIGGLGKVTAAGATWARARQAKKIVTFADHGVSDAGAYHAVGFTLDKELPPNYTYEVADRRVNKTRFRISRFRSDPELLFQDGMTERQLAELNGLHRVWDSGKDRMVLPL